MKIAFKIAAADIAKAAVQMENQYFKLSDILAICKNVAIAVGSDTKYAIYLSIDKLIQSAGSLSAGVLTASSDYQVLDNSNVDAYQGFNGTSTTGISVAKFIKGTTYLIPVGQYAALNMIPDIKMVPVGGTSVVVTSTKFLYQCSEDTEILNDVDVSDVITVQTLGNVLLQSELASQQKKNTRAVKTMLSVGVTESTVNQLINR